MSQLEKVGLLVYTAIKSGMLSSGKEYDFDFTMSSWNQKLGGKAYLQRLYGIRTWVCSPDRYQNWSRNVIRNRESFFTYTPTKLIVCGF